ncbi:hypothetical protein FLA_2989 [Filimonas lacunae]|nr:hypothetical protein FLA_2989 [Filimonas lacunae]
MISLTTAMGEFVSPKIFYATRIYLALFLISNYYGHLRVAPMEICTNT